MSSRVRFATSLAGGGLLVAAAVLILAESGPRPAQAAVIGSGSSNIGGYPTAATSPVSGLAATANGGHRFLITGAVAGMYPGLSKPLVLVVFNPTNVGITVKSITTTVADASSTCPASDLLVQSFTGTLFVAAGHLATTTVVATMQHSAPDACQGAVFPLSYSGTGQAS